MVSLRRLEGLRAYVALFDGVGEGTMKLVVQRLETEEDIYTYTYTKWFKFPGRQLVVNLEIPLTGCVFPAAGWYAIKLLFDKQDLTQRFLDVFLD
jgi:hypothetical protein